MPLRSQKENSIKITNRREVDLGYGKESDCRANNKGKGGRDEVQKSGEYSQNGMAPPQTETRGHIQGTT